MKTIVAALILVVLSLTAVAPMHAQEEMCPHSAPTLTDLRACVVHAAEIGHIDNAGVAHSLLAKLDAAQAAVERGQNAVAIHQLEAFIHEVEAQSGKHIDAEHAAHMIDHARMVIDALNG